MCVCVGGGQETYLEKARLTDVGSIVKYGSHGLYMTVNIKRSPHEGIKPNKQCSWQAQFECQEDPSRPSLQRRLLDFSGLGAKLCDQE